MSGTEAKLHHGQANDLEACRVAGVVHQLFFICMIETPPGVDAQLLVRSCLCNYPRS